MQDTEPGDIPIHQRLRAALTKGLLALKGDGNTMKSIRERMTLDA